MESITANLPLEYVLTKSSLMQWQLAMIDLQRSMLQPLTNYLGPQQKICTINLKEDRFTEEHNGRLPTIYSDFCALRGWNEFEKLLFVTPYYPIRHLK